MYHIDNFPVYFTLPLSIDYMISRSGMVGLRSIIDRNIRQILGDSF